MIGSPKSFSGNFRIGASTRSLTGSVSIEGLSMEAEVVEPLDVIRLQDSDGAMVGVLLGRAIEYSERRLVTGTWTPPRSSINDVDAYMESLYLSLTGSFLVIVDAPQTQRVYLDARGSIPAVYDAEAEAVGSTAFTLLDHQEAIARFDADLYDTLRIAETGWFPAGLTAHHGVKRLLPNFYLDLDLFTTRRHWPVAPIHLTVEPEGACRRIVEIAERTVSTLQSVEPRYTALTSGNDTRLALAASRSVTTDTTFVTIDYKDLSADVEQASRLAHRFGLNQQVLSVSTTDEAAGLEWHAQTGLCIGGINMTTFPTLRQLGSGICFIGGDGGGFGKGNLWRPGDAPSDPITAGSITARCGLPPDPRVENAINDWLTTVEEFDTLVVLELAFLEIRVGCWGFAAALTSPDRISLNPFVGRETYSLVLGLPESWKRMTGSSNRYMRTCVEQCWPELLEIPIGEFGDWRDRARTLRRIVRDPRSIVRKLRKMLR